MTLSNQLTARKVATVKAEGLYCDGGGLYLQVSPSAKRGIVTRSWIFRFSSPLTGKVRDMGLGSIQTFNLKEARERAREYRQLVALGDDPSEVRLRKRDEARATASERILFKDASQRFIEMHEAGWKNAKHREQWKNTLDQYAYPALGTRAISAIDSALINEALLPIWSKKVETARRTKQRIERVIQWVKAGLWHRFRRYPFSVRRALLPGLIQLGTPRPRAPILNVKAPQDAAGFKAWLQAISQNVAEASSEGGFLGIGGVKVSDAEKATLADISKALGTRA